MKLRNILRLFGAEPLYRSMRLIPRFLWAFYAGLLLNSVFLFFWGDAGISRMKTLQDHRDKLIENIAELERIHDELVIERDSLLYDRSAIELHARTFGYRRDGEIPVILPAGKANASSRTLGILIRRTTGLGRNTAMLRIVALGLSIAVFVGSFFRRQHGRSSRQ